LGIYCKKKAKAESSLGGNLLQENGKSWKQSRLEFAARIWQKLEAALAGIYCKKMAKAGSSLGGNLLQEKQKQPQQEFNERNFLKL
jgi:hypothetical protein